MIRSFADRDTADLFNGYSVRKFQSVERSAFKKLRILDAAVNLSDLKLPSLHLEKLKHWEETAQHPSQRQISIASTVRMMARYQRSRWTIINGLNRYMLMMTKETSKTVVHPAKSFSIELQEPT